MGAMLSSFLPLIIMIVVFYFLIILPQKKKDKKFKEMLANMQKGDAIVTIGGIEGRVSQIKDTTVTVEVGSDNTKLVLQKWAIKSVEQKEKA
ncbi:MAG: preprotein translocase subunit YajC [Clostridia bacterium]|nr:preprotein translocase subunit YajC [Clostridia bacterium]